MTNLTRSTHKLLIAVIFCALSGLTIGLTGCGLLPDSTPPASAQYPTVAQSAADQPISADASVPYAPAAPVNVVNAGTGGGAAQTACAVPAEWVAYQMQQNETIYSVAQRGTLSAGDLLRANCQTNPAVWRAGMWLYVPPEIADSAPETLLPLGISALVVEPQMAAAGELVRLVWKAQGPVVRVRVGWLDGNRFVEQATNLPALGIWDAQVPAIEGRTVTFVVRASDGLQEVAAHIMVHIRCSENWFFDPAPADCPTPSLATTFIEQPFERGVIVYVPALGTHYVLITGRAGQRVPDTVTAAVSDPAVVPDGLGLPTGLIHTAWNSDETMRGALGYTTGAVVRTTGQMQRVPGTNTVYFSSGAGGVYRVTDGGAWGVVGRQ